MLLAKPKDGDIGLGKWRYGYGIDPCFGRAFRESCTWAAPRWGVVDHVMVKVPEVGEWPAEVLP